MYFVISKEDRDANFPIENSNGGVWLPVDCEEGAYLPTEGTEEVILFLKENDINYSLVDSVTVPTIEIE